MDNSCHSDQKLSKIQTSGQKTTLARASLERQGGVGVRDGAEGDDGALGGLGLLGVGGGHLPLLTGGARCAHHHRVALPGGRG